MINCRLANFTPRFLAAWTYIGILSTECLPFNGAVRTRNAGLASTASLIADPHLAEICLLPSFLTSSDCFLVFGTVDAIVHSCLLLVYLAIFLGIAIPLFLVLSPVDVIAFLTLALQPVWLASVLKEAIQRLDLATLSTKLVGIVLMKFLLAQFQSLRGGQMMFLEARLAPRLQPVIGTPALTELLK